MTSHYEKKNSHALIKIANQYYDEENINQALDLYAQAYLNGESEVNFI